MLRSTCLHFLEPVGGALQCSRGGPRSTRRARMASLAHMSLLLTDFELTIDLTIVNVAYVLLNPISSV